MTARSDEAANSGQVKLPPLGPLIGGLGPVHRRAGKFGELPAQRSGACRPVFFAATHVNFTGKYRLPHGGPMGHCDLISSQRETREVGMGVLILKCPITGREFSTGTFADEETFQHPIRSPRRRVRIASGCTVGGRKRRVGRILSGRNAVQPKTRVAGLWASSGSMLAGRARATPESLGSRIASKIKSPPRA